MLGLKTLSVYARIGILGGLIGFTLIALAATLYFSDRATSAALAHQQNFSEIERLSLEMEIGVLQMRRREKDFLLRGETRYFDAYREQADQVAELLDRIDGLDTPAEIDAAIDRLRSALPRHREVFAGVVQEQIRLGLTHDTGLQGALRGAVHDVETRLNGFDDAELTVLMLMMRRHEKDFMLQGAPRYIEAFDARQAEFADQLAGRDYPAAERENISALMRAYADGFHAWAEGELAQQETMGQLSEIFAAMDPDFTTIVDTAREGGRMAAAELAQDRARIRQLTIIMVALIALVSGLTCWLVGRSIARPIDALTRAMGDLTRGRTDGTIPATGEGGEIGQMADAVLVFQQNQIEMDRMRAEQAAAEERSAAEKRRLMNEMADEFDANVGSIAQDVAQAAQAMIAIAEQLRQTAHESDERSTIVASAAEETSANTQSVASAAEELTSSIREINRQVTESQNLTRNAVQEADDTRSTVTGLSEAVARIGNVVTLIQSIAEQTNLLALNATIEASRAGDAGKGFAVVASEVKALADQTGQATHEIAAQIEAIQKNGDHAVTAIGAMTTMIDQVSRSTTAIASAIEQQDAAAREIAGSVNQAAQGSAQVTESTAVLADNVRETDSGASRVLDAARGVSSDSDRLRTALSGFLEQIRAA